MADKDREKVERIELERKAKLAEKEAKAKAKAALEKEDEHPVRVAVRRKRLAILLALGQKLECEILPEMVSLNPQFQPIRIQTLQRWRDFFMELSHRINRVTESVKPPQE